MKCVGCKPSRFKARPSLLAVIAIACLASWGPRWVAGGQSSQESFVAGEEGRPLSEAIRRLESRFGWIITYQDPAYEHVQDIEDVTTSVSRDPDLSKRVLIPRYVPFAFAFDIPTAGQPADPQTLLSRLLSEYHSSGNPGQFQLKESGTGVFHVLPVLIRDKAGNLVGQLSLLDTQLSLPQRDRTVREIVSEVLDSITRMTGIRVLSGSGPNNLYAQTVVPSGGRTEAARDMLLRAFEATGRKLSWHLLYSPGQKLYMFNVHIVPDLAAEPVE